MLELRPDFHMSEAVTGWIRSETYQIPWTTFAKQIFMPHKWLKLLLAFEMYLMESLMIQLQSTLVFLIWRSEAEFLDTFESFSKAFCGLEAFQGSFQTFYTDCVLNRKHWNWEDNFNKIERTRFANRKILLTNIVENWKREPYSVTEALHYANSRFFFAKTRGIYKNLFRFKASIEWFNEIDFDLINSGVKTRSSK